MLLQASMRAVGRRGLRLAVPRAVAASQGMPSDGVTTRQHSSANFVPVMPLSKRKKPYNDDDYKLDDAKPFLAPLRMAAEVPDREGFNTRYNLEKNVGVVATIVSNQIGWSADRLFDPLDKMVEFEDVFKTIDAPGVVHDGQWRTDASFGDQRVAGLHPNVIEYREEIGSLEKLENSGDNFAGANFAAVKHAAQVVFGSAPGAPATGTPAERRAADEAHAAKQDLFICDWSQYIHQPLVSTHRGHPMATLPVRLLLGWDDTLAGNQGDLMPIAIEVQMRNGKTHVITPYSHPKGYWQAAKVYAGVADSNVHELRSHLYRAHFAQEPIAVLAGHHLHPSHPVRQLLTPHHRFLLANNDLGRRKLVNPGGVVDSLLGGTLNASLNLVKVAAEEYDFEQHSFWKDMENRGMHDTKLPHYPFRDDGLLVWDAIGKFVTDFLAPIYPDQQALNDDAQLQAWWEAIVSQSGIKGIPGPGSVGELAFILQNMIFTAGPYHSAVNYTQLGFLSFSPNQTLASYADVDFEDPTPFTDDKMLHLLPPAGQVIAQTHTAYFLAGYRYDKLGDYTGTKLPRTAKAAVDRFHAELHAVATRIHRRNKKRTIPYEYLLPDNITNSTSV